MSKTELVSLPNGQRVNTQRDGKPGAPWLLFSNSHATDLSLWDDQVAVLADSYQILRYDHRGHGKTPAVTPPPYHINDLIADALGLLDHFKISSTHVIGISMGGAVSLGLTLKYPQRILSATVCDSGAGSHPDGGKDWDPRIAVAREQGVPALADPTVARWFAKASQEAHMPAIDKVRAMIRTTTTDGYAGCANALQSIDMEKGLENIKTPMLLIAGELDGTRPAGMKQIAARIPGAKFAVIPGAGHLSNIEKPKEFNAAMLEFLNGLKK